MKVCKGGKGLKGRKRKHAGRKMNVKNRAGGAQKENPCSGKKKGGIRVVGGTRK